MTPFALTRVISLSAICLFLLVAPVACHTRDATWQAIQASGRLKFGLDPTYPPFEVTTADGLQGIDIELGRAVAARLGVQAEFVLFGYDGLYDALATRQVDVLLSALVIVPERTRDFAYSDSYFDAGQLLVVPAADAGEPTMPDLDGRILAVELGSQGHVEAIAWSHRLPALTIRPFTTAEEALAAVAGGSASAALVDAIGGRLYLKEHRELRRAAAPVTMEPFAMVVRIDDERLLQELNIALAGLSQSGELEAIITRWLGE